MNVIIRRLYIGLLLVILVLPTVGCELSKKKDVEASSKSQFTLEVKGLQGLSDKTIFYTKSREVISNTGISNIFYNIQEYYNSNKKEYYYVLTLKKQMEIILYDIIKFSVGATQNKDTNSFIHTVSSPVFIEFEKSYVKDGSYYLFSSNKSIDTEDFQLEGIFVNSVPIKDKKAGEETFRFITNVNKSLITN
ncbi:hypothetical protein [Peribacillus loiseleuriae]|uniref:hypothetical protein n=1 Tax=Peribacillus loiseleuriae TaxID=1679170 RepID=UPI003CFCF1E2